MALDGPCTLDDLLRMTGHKPKSRNPKSEIRNLKSEIRNLKSKSVRLLGVDPGTRFVGWGVIERRGSGALELVACGCIAPGRKLGLKERLRVIFEELEAVIARARPDAAALEETFAGVNMKSAIAMGEGRGIALLCLARAEIEVLELSPRSIKQAVTGSGAAGKGRVAAMVAAQLGLKAPPQPADVSDALAAAIALARRV